jgi:hypothetical protein
MTNETLIGLAYVPYINAQGEPDVDQICRDNPGDRWMSTTTGGRWPEGVELPIIFKNKSDALAFARDNLLGD